MADLTPVQASIFSADIARDHQATAKAILLEAGRTPHADKRFPGKQIVTFKSIAEWRDWQRARQ